MDPGPAPRSPPPVKKLALHFSGTGSYLEKPWDIASAAAPAGFSWYHVELPRLPHRLSSSASLLISALCPPLLLHDILSLVSTGPLCSQLSNNALVFRVNSPGPANSPFTLRLAVRVTEHSLITVSLGKVPRLGFQTGSAGRRSLLEEVPSAVEGEGIPEHVLDFFLTMNHSEEADNPVPRTVGELIVHVVDTHVDHVQDMVAKLEMELDLVELELDKGGPALKKQMLDDRRFPKMHLNLQRLLQVVAHGEQVFPRVKEKCATKSWFASEDIASLDELIGRLRRLKENLGFIANRVTAVQAGLDSWQAEQINRKLYYLSFLSLTFLPLSIVTGVFGMNVGGVPWTGKKDPALKDGFRNVLLLCAAMVFLILFCITSPYLYARFSTWRRQRALKRSWSLNSKSARRTFPQSGFQRGAYTRI